MAARDWTRRAVLAAAALAPLADRRARADAAPLRVAALDWGLASTVAALGAGPFAVAECASYGRWVREPALPADVRELGLRTNPSFESLAALNPDLILINSLNENIRPRLDTIAPTFSNTIFTADRAPLARAMAMTRDLGARLGRAGQAEALIARTETCFAAASARLRPRPVRPLVPIGFIDGRHVRIYGAGSLFDDVMRRLGLVGGWRGPTNFWGFAIAAIEALAACPDADILVIDPVPADARRAMAEQGLWSGLIAAGRARVTMLPAVWAFGDLYAAGRFADVIADRLAPRKAGSSSSSPGGKPIDG